MTELARIAHNQGVGSRILEHPLCVSPPQDFSHPAKMKIAGDRGGFAAKQVVASNDR